MVANIPQPHLDIQAEEFSVKEKLIIRRLKEYRTIERDIRQQRRIISGELTRCLPSVAPGGLPEDDIEILAKLETQQMSEEFSFMVRTVGKHVDMAQARYTNRTRVAKRLQHIAVNDEKEDQAIQDAYMILTEKEEEEYLKLTPAERYASDREKEVEEAQDELWRLLRLKTVIGPALEDMHTYHLEWWTILTKQYVMSEKRESVRKGLHLTEQNYRTERHKALHQFGKWAIGLS